MRNYRSIYIEFLIGKHCNKHIGLFILTLMNLCVIMRPRIIKNSNNLFKQQFLMHSL
jgi:hypothetical protein